MKITSQGADEMTLKEGDISILIISGIIIVATLFFGFASLSSLTGVGLLVLGLLFLGGLIGMFVSSSIIVTISKANNQITYQKKRLVGGSNATFAISDVLRVETRRSWQAVSSSRNPNQTGFSATVPRERLVTQSVIIMKDGTELALDRKNAGANFSVGGVGITPGVGKEINIATQVANFMGVTFQEIQPPNSGMGINIGGANIQL